MPALTQVKLWMATHPLPTALIAFVAGALIF